MAELYRVLDEKVTWPMNLYVQYYNPERFDYRAALPNPNIRIVRFHTQLYRGFRGVEFWLFRRGLRVPASGPWCWCANTSPCSWGIRRWNCTGWITHAAGRPVRG
ncbi:MAG: hypothetical protein ACLVK4_14785 [Alistipes shahii]|uniref:hypothetical protein n=1 Tax=Alistipes shahii TaxID=328814 RepID=UPI00399CFE83